MKIWLFANPDWKPGRKIFTHFWSNDGENYYDSVRQIVNPYGRHIEKEAIDFVSIHDGSKGPTEAYLEKYKNEGYRWIEMDESRIQRHNIDSFDYEMTNAEFAQHPFLFFKITDYDESNVETLPLYYYSAEISEASDQNFTRTSYRVICKLDLWATIWIYMHSYMKSCPEQLDFIQKMCDRFIFNEQFDEKGNRIPSQGFYLDYLQQPYLMRTKKYESNLIVGDKRENFLTLEEFLYINSGKKNIENFQTWLDETWYKWIDNPWVGAFSPKGLDAEVHTAYQAKDIGKIQNKNSIKLDGFYDTDYNSNSKYRYLVCRVGNNTHPTEKTKLDYKEGMFEKLGFKAVKYSSDKSTGHPTFDTSKWYKEEGKFEWYKSMALATDLNLQTGAIAIQWDNFFCSQKRIPIVLSDTNSGLLGTYTIYWTDDLQLKSYTKILNGYEYGKEYDLIDLPTKSFLLNVDTEYKELNRVLSDFVNCNLKIKIVFDDEHTARLVFRFSIDKNYETVYGDWEVRLANQINVNSLKISETAVSSDVDGMRLNGETLMIVPFKKGKDELKYIEYLNSIDKGILLGDGYLLGMPVNDIPPSVLALAMRRWNDYTLEQSIGDMISVRGIESGGSVLEVPADIVSLHFDDLDMPVMFSGFDYIPVVIASSPVGKEIYNCVGGNIFFNYFYDILTSEITLLNIPDCEPFLYSPQFWKWTYFIDGNHKIELTADKIDFKKMLLSEDWEVRLNVNLNATTNYFLDITDIKNNKYPMSKIGVEMITQDGSTYPFTTEAYNNWLQENQTTQETSKNAREITNKYVGARGLIDATFGATEAGLKVAAGGSTIFSQAVTAGLGVGAAAAHATGALLGTALTTTENIQKWDNEWNGKLANYYSTPSQLNPSGFTSGSLIYSPIGKSNQNSYELFRTFMLPEINISKVWNDISMNGYEFLGQCTYAEYNNRVNFNVVNCNLLLKRFFIMNYLKTKIAALSPLLAQNDSVYSFMDKCQKKFRVFKCEYDESKMNEIVAGNIELTREWVEPYFAPKRLVSIPFTNVQRDDATVDDYEWEPHPEENSYRYQKIGNENSKEISYASLDVSNWNEFIKTYPHLAFNQKGSYTGKVENDKPVQESIVINDSEYGPMTINTATENHKFFDSVIANDYSINAIVAEIDREIIKPNKYTVGYDVTLEEKPDKTGIIIKVTPMSWWTFYYNDPEIEHSKVLITPVKGEKEVKINLNVTNNWLFERKKKDDKWNRDGRFEEAGTAGLRFDDNFTFNIDKINYIDFGLPEITDKESYLKYIESEYIKIDGHVELNRWKDSIFYRSISDKVTVGEKIFNELAIRHRAAPDNDPGEGHFIRRYELIGAPEMHLSPLKINTNIVKDTEGIELNISTNVISETDAGFYLGHDLCNCYDGKDFGTQDERFEMDVKPLEFIAKFNFGGESFGQWWMNNIINSITFIKKDETNIYGIKKK